MVCHLPTADGWTSASPKKFKDFEDNLFCIKKDTSLTSYLGSPETTPSRFESFETPMGSHFDDFPQSPFAYYNYNNNNITHQKLLG